MSFFIFYFFVATLYRSWKYVALFAVAVMMFVLPQSRSVAVGFLVVSPLVLMLLGIKIQKGTLTKPYFY